MIALESNDFVALILRIVVVVGLLGTPFPLEAQWRSHPMAWRGDSVARFVPDSTTCRGRALRIVGGDEDDVTMLSVEKEFRVCMLGRAWRVVTVVRDEEPCNPVVVEWIDAVPTAADSLLLRAYSTQLERQLRWWLAQPRILGSGDGRFAFRLVVEGLTGTISGARTVTGGAEGLLSLSLVDPLRVTTAFPADTLRRFLTEGVVALARKCLAETFVDKDEVLTGGGTIRSP